MDKNLLTATVEECIAGTDIFIVDIRIEAGNRVVVELDSPTGLDIDTCAAITRKIESVFDRDAEDYELEVGSAGLTAPFKVRGQYEKNLGNEVEILTRDGQKFSGVLTELNPDEDVFTVEVPVKVKKADAKRPVIEMQPRTLAFADCKYVKYLINFK